MLETILTFLLPTLGACALARYISPKSSLKVIIAVGITLGQAILGSFLFISALFFGLGYTSIAFALILSLLPACIFFTNKDALKEIQGKIRAVSKRLKRPQKAELPAILSGFSFLVFSFLFFRRAIFFNQDGIYTGGSQNLGDLPFHLGAIFSFAFGGNFPPENPNFAGFRFNYPFIVDLNTAAAVYLGGGIADAMLVQNILLSFSLIILLVEFSGKLIGSERTGWLPGILFLLSGGLGFYYLINDFFQSNQSFFEFLFSIPRDYTIGEDFRWGNTLTTLLITQRSLLLGLPLTLFLIISINSFREKEGEPSAASNLSKPLILGFIAGLLPLIHLHSLIVLFIVSLFNFLFYKSARRRLLFFGAATAVFALAELFWASAGSASDAEKFIAFAPGWDSQGNNLIWFWLKNTGLLIPLTILGFFLRYSSYDKDNKPEIKDLFFGYIPFAVIFLLSNLFKFAPWQWDNIKLLVYWLAASAAFAAYALAIIWQQPRFGKPIAAILFICLTLAGASDVWRTISSAINYRVFDAQAAAFGDAARSKLPSKSVILNAPTYNTASVLTGGLSFMRYPGHLASHGIDYTTRESITNEIYRGGSRAKQLIQENRINYVLISPAEKSMLYVNEQFFRQFPLETEIGNYRLYKVR